MDNLDFVNFQNALRLIYRGQRYEHFDNGLRRRAVPTAIPIEVEEGNEILFRFKMGEDEGKKDFRVWCNSLHRMYQLRTDKYRTRLVIKEFSIKDQDKGKEKLDFAHYFIDPENITEEEFMLFSMIAGSCIKYINRLSYAQSFFIGRKVNAKN